MKKKLLVILTLALMFLAACGNSEGGTGSAEETASLRVSSSLPDTHQWMIGFFNPWIEQIEEEAGDKVKIDVFTSGELVAVREEFDALNSGTIDVAAPMHPIYDAERFPLTEVTMLPILTSDVSISTEAYKNLLASDVEIKDGKNFMELVYEDNNLKVFPMVSTQPYVISTTSDQIDSADDLKGLKLRSGARVHDLFVKNIGANPISMPFTDLYDSLSKGTLDGALLAVPDWSSYGIESLFTYTIEGINLGHYTAAPAMTMDTWNKIPSDVQKIMDEAAEANLQTGVDNWLKVNETVVADSKAAGGEFVNINELDSSLQDALIKATEETWMQWIEVVEDQGYPAREVAKLWRDLIIEAGGEVPESVKGL